MEPKELLYQRLLEDDRFVRWVTGEAPADDGYWQEWSADEPIRQEVMVQARLTVLAIQGKPVILSEQAIADRIQQALNKAKLQEAATNLKMVRRVRYLTPYRWVAAASVALLMGLGWFAYTHYDVPVEHQPVGQMHQSVDRSAKANPFVTITNAGKAARHVLLPDGSSVVLRRNSQVSYRPVGTAGKREAYLSGEAFFEVTKDPTKPFFVYANGLVTKVLGTSFNVKAHQQAQQVIVVVRTGKVAVFTQTDAKSAALRNNRDLTGMVLLPNQQATFKRTEARLTRTDVQSPIPTQPFEYKATPIAEVFASLEKTYGVTIQFDREIMAHCSLSATLGDEPLQKKLQWICAILEATYQINDQQVIVTGKPCQ